MHTRIFAQFVLCPIDMTKFQNNKEVEFMETDMQSQASSLYSIFIVLIMKFVFVRFWWGSKAMVTVA